MTDSPKITFFHAPNTRSSAVLRLLEEMKAPYTLNLLNMKAGEQREPAYLAINPLGKVPAILDGDALVTEQVAIFIHLADLFPEAGLAPPIGDPARGPYLRWLVYYAACFEPALMDLMRGVGPGETKSSPYGDYDAMLDTLAARLEAGPYILGDRFSAADVLWGTALAWTIQFKLVPERPVFIDYVARQAARPASVSAQAKDAAWAAEQETAE